MAEFKILYWHSRGNAEVARIALELAGKEYVEDNCSDETWPERKKEWMSKGYLPYGQVPILQHNGNNIAQSGTILRYLGRLYNYYYLK